MAENEELMAMSSLPLTVFLIGLFLMFAGVIVLIASALLSGNGTMRGGVIIFIGPIPIVLGAGPHALLAVVVAAVLTVIGFVIFLWMRRQVSRG